MINWGSCGFGTGDSRILTFNCISSLISGLISVLIIFAGTVALFFIIFGGIKFLTSQGEPEKVASARKTLTWAIIGLVLVLMAVGIVNIISQLTGVPCSTLGLGIACK